jgi:periplasmic protein TonB
MELLRPIAVLLSIGAHVALAAAFMTSEPATSAFDQGTGSDAFNSDMTITLDGSSMLGGAEEIVETPDVAPVQQITAAEPVQTKEPELKDIVTSSEATVEAPQEIKEDKPVEEEKPQQVTTQEVAPLVATEQQEVGSKQSGGDAVAQRAYMGEIAKKINRSKVRPSRRLSGTVVLQFTVSPTGELLSHSILQSSGTKELDDAALAALERSAPFPAMPEAAGSKPLPLQVPFNFSVVN